MIPNGLQISDRWNSLIFLASLWLKQEFYTTFSLTFCSLPSDDITHNPTSPFTHLTL